jgi:hypothetical protein
MLSLLNAKISVIVPYGNYGQDEERDHEVSRCETDRRQGERRQQTRDWCTTVLQEQS